MNWKALLSTERNGTKSGREFVDRSAFEQDYDRIIFSTPFRSLQDKTQVFPLPKKDFVHTRLTHSLEVASVGRSLGKLVGEKILIGNKQLLKSGFTPTDFAAISSAASLMHDIGNPPYGHAGENAISEYFRNTDFGRELGGLISEKEYADITNFEGNAQGFRLVNKRNFQGLKLTFATLGAFSKYPRESLYHSVDKRRKSQKKYGFYQSNRSTFTALADTCALIPLANDEEKAWCRHPLAFLVEAADDICYNIIDLEDGTNLGLVRYEHSRDLLAAIIGKDYNQEKLEKIKSTRERIGLLRALAIRRLINQCAQAFIENEKGILEGTFDQALTQCIPAAGTMKTIGEVSFEKIYKSQQVLEREVTGFEVLSGLLRAFTPAVYDYVQNKGKLSWHQSSLFRLLPDETRMDIHASGESLYEAMLSTMDFISGITDSRALDLFRNIKGIS